MLNMHEQYSDLRRILAESAKEHGATLRFNTSVASVHPDRKRPAVTLTNGERLEADVVLGADGCVLPGFITRSAVMEAIKQEDDTVPSGTQVFQCVLSFVLISVVLTLAQHPHSRGGYGALGALEERPRLCELHRCHVF